MRRALIALVAIVLVTTGVAVATPVPVLAMRGSDRQYVAELREGAELFYEYQQSIYEATVIEYFVREGERLRLRKVLSPDIRAIEYFRWDTPIVREGDYYVGEPPPTLVAELVIRVTPAGQQLITGVDGGRTLPLLHWFGEDVVHLTPGRASLVRTLAQGLRR
ncbi:MAG TPA: hypothetical protein VJP45_11755 [Candidatus Limnocylindria bacterium]|nr:hypothetical protein [Candidatus Limnocylindria bacterium]